MITDGDGEASSKGPSSGLSNGSRAPQRALHVASTNGMHKAASTPSANGASHNNGKAATRDTPSPTYFGHDREEVTRLLIQALSDMGYQSAAESVSRDSGYELESPTVAAFKTAVLGGDWGRAEYLLFGACAAADGSSGTGNGLVLAQGADPDAMRFWLRQQKFLELLEQRNTRLALTVLRTELTPLNQDTQKLHFLSGLLMCDSNEELRSKAAWDGASGESRHILLSDLSKCISPSVMLPEHRIAVLLQQVKENQISKCLYHMDAASPSLYSDHKCDRSRFPTESVGEITGQPGEIWDIRFSHDGRRLASCGTDSAVYIWCVLFYVLRLKLEGHDLGVGSIAWSPDDTKLVTCGRDGIARIWDAHNGTLLRQLPRVSEPVSSCAWAPDGRSFVLGTLDIDQSLCQFSAQGDLLYSLTKEHRVEDVALSPDGHWLVAMDNINIFHVYDFMTRELKYEIKGKSGRLTSVAFSQDSRHLLVNSNDGQLTLYDIATKRDVQKYSGNKGGQFVIRGNLGGANESFVITGSEDGFVVVYHKPSGRVVLKEEAHRPRCNAAVWSPTDPCVFATCGDDGTIKIWSNKESQRQSPSDWSGEKSENL